MRLVPRKSPTTVSTLRQMTRATAAQDSPAANLPLTIFAIHASISIRCGAHTIPLSRFADSGLEIFVRQVEVNGLQRSKLILV